jgi:hypothetical protein
MRMIAPSNRHDDRESVKRGSGVLRYGKATEYGSCISALMPMVRSSRALLAMLSCCINPDAATENAQFPPLSILSLLSPLVHHESNGTLLV